MPKLIKKYQWGGTNLREFVPSYTPYTEGTRTGSLAENFMNYTNNYVHSRLKSLELAKNPIVGNSKYTSLLKSIGNPTTNSVTGSTGVKSSFLGKGLGFLGNNGPAVGDVISGGIELLGGKKATMMGVGDQLLDQGANLLMSSGTPWGVIGGGVLKGFSLLNQYGGKNLKKQGTDANLDTGAYAMNISANAGGKTTFFGNLFNPKKARGIDRQTTLADRNNLLASNAQYGNKQNQLNATNTYGDVVTKTQQQLSGGIKTNLLSAKKGTKINPKKLENITNKVKQKIKKAQEGTPTDDLQKMAQGGKIQNVIPEGALHARLNHYEGELGEQVTNKGIPVITIEEGGKITQHAEIEHSEIIFNLEISKKLEDLAKQYKETEDSNTKRMLEIECGKLLTNEILNNTKDNTGLLQKIT